MEIFFGKRSLQKLCESRQGLQREHGQACARKAVSRLLDLEASASLEDMRTLPGRCHELAGDRTGQLAVELSDGKRLVFEPAHDPAPAKRDGGLDWSRVTVVRILAIQNYHRG